MLDYYIVNSMHTTAMSHKDKTSKECVLILFIQYENYVDTILGTLLLIIFQTRHGLKHPHLCILQATLVWT